MKKLILILPFLLTLVSCGSKSGENKEDSFIDSLKKNISLKGKKVITYHGSLSDVKDEYDLELVFAENSYHYYKNGESGSQDDAYWTNDKEKVLDYYIDAENTLQSEVCIDSNTNEYMKWDDFKNPFSSITEDYFVQDGDFYYFDLENEDIIDEIYYIVSVLTREDFVSFSKEYDNVLEEIEFITESNKVTEINIKSGSLVENILYTEYDMSFSFSLENLDDDYNYPYPEVLETKPYHENLISAVDSLISRENPYAVNTTIKSSESSSYHYYSVVDKDLLYNKDVDGDIMYAFIAKDDGVHQLVRNKSEMYGYLEDLVLLTSGDYLTDISKISPFKGAALQNFLYDENTQEYYFEGSSAGLFGYCISPFRNNDEVCYYKTSIKIKLTDDNKIDYISLDDGNILMEYDYENINLPFVKEELDIFTTYDFYRGKYKFTCNDEEVTLIIDKNYKITWNGNECEFISIEQTMYSLVFYYNGNDYMITSSYQTITDTTNNITYTLERIG